MIGDRSDSEFFTDDGDGNGKLDLDGDDDREHTGRDLALTPFDKLLSNLGVSHIQRVSIGV